MMSRLTTTSTISVRSSGIFCRICQDNRSDEDLISPCKCAGTMGFVHSSCLEKWLSQSAQTNCELCKHDFKTVITGRPFYEWLSDAVDMNSERRYIIIDTGCFLMLTPLGIVSSWLCIQGAQIYYNDKHFWTGFGLILLTGFLMMMYILWIIITIRYHYLTFKTWQIENSTVHLIFSNQQVNSNRPSRCTLNNRKEDNDKSSNQVECTKEVVVNVVDNHTRTYTTTDNEDNDEIEEINHNGAYVTMIQTFQTNETPSCGSNRETVI